MLHFCDFVTCRKKYDNQSRGVYISALEHCIKMKFRTYLHLTHVILWCVVQTFLLGVVGTISKVTNMM